MPTSAAWKEFLEGGPANPQGVRCAEPHVIMGPVREWETRAQARSFSRLVPVGALMAIVGGGLLVAIPLRYRGFLLANAQLAAEAMFNVGLYFLVVVALFLVPMGMVGFHALQMRNYGLVGHTGFWTVVIASVMVASGVAGYLWWEDSTLLWLVSPVGALGLVVGFVLYGAATLYARVLPLWCGMTFMIALPAAIALVWIRPFFGLGEGTSTTSILFGLAWIGLGYVLWTRRRARR
jgi:hypothetical protein